MLKDSKEKVQERAYISTWSSTVESKKYVAVRETVFFFFFEVECSI